MLYEIAAKVQANFLRTFLLLILSFMKTENSYGEWFAEDQSEN